jgi:hypothetical protein
LAFKNRMLKVRGTKTPDKTHVIVGGSFASSVTTLDIEAATVPGAMIVALLPVLRLPAGTVRHRPLRHQIPLSDGPKSCQPEHDAATGQGSSNLYSYSS